MTSLHRVLCAAAVLSCAHAATADTVTVLLDEDHQGKGNKGTEFRPLDEHGELAGFLMTARSSVDDASPFEPLAAGETGTVYIDKDDKGAGTQAGDEGGSSGISGGGGDKDEELIFTFDMPTLAEALELQLNEFEAGDGLDDKDDMVLFISLAGLPDPVMLTEYDYMSAFTPTDDKRGILSFAGLGLGTGALISGFTVRETEDHVYVNGLSYGGGIAAVPLPAPVFMGAAGLAAAGLWRRRRNKTA